MRSLIRCHFYYGMTKSVIVFWISSMCGLLLLLCVNAINIIDTSSIMDWIDTYFESSIYSMKLIVGLLSIFSFAHTIFPKNDFYAYFILTSNISRVKYMLSKIITQLFIYTILFIGLIFFYCLIGLICNPHFYITLQQLMHVCLVYCMCMVFGLYAMIGIQLGQHLFTILVPFTCLIISFDFMQSQDHDWFEMVFLFAFPHPTISQSMDLITWMHIVWLAFVLLCLNILIYRHRDLNY